MRRKILFGLLDILRIGPIGPSITRIYIQIGLLPRARHLVLVPIITVNRQIGFINSKDPISNKVLLTSNKLSNQSSYRLPTATQTQTRLLASRLLKVIILFALSKIVNSRSIVFNNSDIDSHVLYVLINILLIITRDIKIPTYMTTKQNMKHTRIYSTKVQTGYHKTIPSIPLAMTAKPARTKAPMRILPTLLETLSRDILLLPPRLYHINQGPQNLPSVENVSNTSHLATSYIVILDLTHILMLL